MRPTFIAMLVAFLPFFGHAQQYNSDMPVNTASEYYRQQLINQVMQQLDKIDWNNAERTTGGAPLYTIPVVVHVLHNYGSELISDNSIFSLIDIMNSYFLKTRADTINIIDKFKSVAASTQIAFKLATIDPNGNPTKGISHTFTYLTNVNDAFPDQSKIGQWPQNKYLNIWLIANLQYTVGYGYPPYNASVAPYYDGVILESYYAQTRPSLGAMHAGRYLNLRSPCGSTSFPALCTDNDAIPDTPPCIANSAACVNVYDTTCDTPNKQNIMYSNGDTCALMFTYGQGQYMQAVLQNSIGQRNNLVTPANFIATGMNQPMPDMSPVADFSIMSAYKPRWFAFTNQNVNFQDRSWNDTITSVAWTFSNDATVPFSSASAVANKFASPGWVTVSLTATGNNTGSTTLTNSHTLYIADTTPSNAVGYFQEFEPSGDINKWPMFNYYNNGFKWQPTSPGYTDNSCIMYTGFDTRSFPENATGIPQGDYDDLFTPVFDLTPFTADCYLNFMSSGATNTLNNNAFNDSLRIEYSTSLGAGWQKLQTLSKGQLANKTSAGIFYEPLWPANWVSQAIAIPVAIRKRQTIFRFRYFPGADSAGNSTGNNFYMDRFNLSAFPAGAENIVAEKESILLYPNPATRNAFVVISNAGSNVTATIIVTDILGKEIYKTTTLVNNKKQIEIPSATISNKGVYMIHVNYGTKNHTEKLVVW